MKIQKTGHNDSKLKCLLYAPSGYGKTFSAGTLEGRTLIISAESGLLSLANKEIDYFDITEGCKTPFEKINNLILIYRELEKGMEYDNVFIDSLSEIAQVFVEHFQKEYPEKKDSMNLWGEYAKKIRGFVKMFRDLNQYNVIMTAIEKVDKDELGRRFKIPDLNGSIATQLPQYFDEVFAIRILEEGKRVFQTDGRDNYVCKDRSGRLDAFEDCNLGNVFAKIKKGI